MDRAKIHQAVEMAVGEWRGSIDGGPDVLKSGAKPVGGVEGFDSYSGVVATIQLEVKLGVSLTTDNVFLSKDGNHARTVEDIVDSINEALEEENK